MIAPAVLGLTLVFAAGCAPADGDRGGGEAATPSITVVKLPDGQFASGPAQGVKLSLAEPSREVAPPAAAASAELLTVVVTQVDNPTRRAFTIVAELRTPDRPPVRVGSFAPYPADQPGGYVFDWKAPAAQVGSGAKLVLTLQPLRPAEAGDIAVDVAPHWGRGRD